MKGEYRGVEFNQALKGCRQVNAYYPAANEVCEVSGPNCDDENGYTWAETTLLWSNDIFVLYGSEGYWPTLHRRTHVIFRPANPAARPAQ